MVSPGFINTDQTSHMPEDLRKWQANMVPIKRFSEPHEQTGQALYVTFSRLSRSFSDSYPYRQVAAQLKIELPNWQ